jgi:hypothetical protein
MLAGPSCKITTQATTSKPQPSVESSRGKFIAASRAERRQKCVQALRAPCPQRQYRRGEAKPFDIAGRRAIPNLHPGHLDSADPRLDRPHWAVAVPNEAVAAVGKLQALHRGEKRLGFHLDSLRKQLPRTRSQNIRQWIVDLVGLTERDNVDRPPLGVVPFD